MSCGGVIRGQFQPEPDRIRHRCGKLGVSSLWPCISRNGRHVRLPRDAFGKFSRKAGSDVRIGMLGTDDQLRSFPRALDEKHVSHWVNIADQDDFIAAEPDL